MAKKIIWLGITAIAVAVVLGLTPALAQDKVYINGFDAAYPPF